MAITWHVQDDSNSKITDGLKGLKYGGIIQVNDGLGGYNTLFSINGSQAFYHVHFNLGTLQVTCLRHFAGSGVQGNNVVNSSNPASTFSGIRKDIDEKQFPNSYKLMGEFATLINGLPKAPSGQLK